jgi:tetrahydromethanopterin S-methyltransferase subunit D
MSFQIRIVLALVLTALAILFVGWSAHFTSIGLGWLTAQLGWSSRDAGTVFLAGFCILTGVIGGIFLVSMPVITLLFCWNDPKRPLPQC